MTGSGRHVLAKPARACVWSAIDVSELRDRDRRESGSAGRSTTAAACVVARDRWAATGSARPSGMVPRPGSGFPSAVRPAVPLPRCACDAVGDECAVQCGDVGGVDGMQNVAGGEDALLAGAQGGVDHGSLGARSRCSMPALRASSWSGIQSPVKMTVSQSMTGGRRCRGSPLRRRCRVWLADDPHDPGAGGDRDPQQRFARDVECGVGLRGGVFGGHRDGGTSGVSQCHHGRPADQLGADDDGSFADLAVVQVHDVLQLPGGVTPDGRSPGISRAGRGRSRAPVAMMTAPGCTRSRPRAW